mgnify:CR=1 FL=1
MSALENGLQPNSLILDAPFVVDQGSDLGKWKPEERLVLDTIENLNNEPYDHTIDTIDPDEPTDLPGESYVDSLLTTGFDNEPTEIEWLESKAELALGI